MHFRVLVITGFLLTLLSGCVAVPRNGPTTEKVLAEAAYIENNPENVFVYDVFNLSQEVIGAITNYHSAVFKRNFGSASRHKYPVLGIGDQLTITIFEASPDGLFSTTDNKSTTINVVIQPNGKAAIPYVGNLALAGKPLQRARTMILSALEGKAVEPDVVLNLTSNASRQVVVTGEVKSSAQIELGLRGNTLLEVIALAGGPTRNSFDTKVTVLRGKTRATTRLSNVIEHPNENIYVQPNDHIVLENDPSRFLVLGASGTQGRIEFNSPDINLIEAVALAGDKDSSQADPKGVFIFRYENRLSVEHLMGKQAFEERLALGKWDIDAYKFPVVYRLDMSEPSSYLVGQNFAVRSGDLLYLASHPSTEFSKFLRLVGLSLGTVRAATRL